QASKMTRAIWLAWTPALSPTSRLRVSTSLWATAPTSSTGMAQLGREAPGCGGPSASGPPEASASPADTAPNATRVLMPRVAARGVGGAGDGGGRKVVVELVDAAGEALLGARAGAVTVSEPAIGVGGADQRVAAHQPALLMGEGALEDLGGHAVGVGEFLQ